LSVLRTGRHCTNYQHTSSSSTFEKRNRRYQAIDYPQSLLGNPIVPPPFPSPMESSLESLTTSLRCSDSLPHNRYMRKSVMCSTQRWHTLSKSWDWPWSDGLLRERSCSSLTVCLEPHATLPHYLQQSSTELKHTDTNNELNSSSAAAMYTTVYSCALAR
jgi:hypothetical protein